MMTCSSSGTSRITSATSAGGHSRNTSRSAPKSRASIMLLISGSKILPTITDPNRRRVLTPRFARSNGSGVVSQTHRAHPSHPSHYPITLSLQYSGFVSVFGNLPETASCHPSEVEEALTIVLWRDSVSAWNLRETNQGNSYAG